MIVYSVIMFAAAAACIVLGGCIAMGNTNLINCYHPERVSDKTTYCKKMGQGMLVMGGALALSGIVGLLGEALALAAVGVLVAGQIGGLALLIRVQKKYGGGIF